MSRFKYIVKSIHFDKSHDTISNVEKVRCTDWDEVLRICRRMWDDWSSIDDEILKEKKEVRLNCWNVIRVENYDFPS